MSPSPHPLVIRGRDALQRGDTPAALAAAEALFVNGRRGDAEFIARAALRANPRSAQAHNLFGLMLSELNDLPSGEWHFRQALVIAGPHAAACVNLAINLMRQGRTMEAEPFFAQADALAPRELNTLAHWSKLYEVQGDLARAQAMLDRAEAASSPAAVNLLRATFLSRQGKPAEALAIINAAPQLNGDGQLERGRLHDRLGRFEEAWRDFVEGKKKLAAEAGGLEYQAHAVETFFARLKTFFVRTRLELLPRTTARLDTPQPIFVMGFPRSGTTLIEQVLSSHSAVLAGGELSFIGELRKLANALFSSPEPFPENLAQTWTADHRFAATLFRDYYLARAEQYGLLASGKAYFVDKMPFNEIWLPVLRMAFPEARIVHVIRHPLDVCVSVMANHLTHGFNCGYRIEDIVHHFAAVFDLVEHYRKQLEIGELALRYETFVANQLEETRRLLDYVGLPFEEACLTFHENRRYAPTPSYAQVTEKLNDRSIDRHRHYVQHLRPYLPQLAPMMRANGYE